MQGYAPQLKGRANSGKFQFPRGGTWKDLAETPLLDRFEGDVGLHAHMHTARCPFVPSTARRATHENIED